MTWRIALAQINPIVGDIDGNTAKIKSAINTVTANQHKIDLIVFPEMVITGYPPEDLLLRQEIYKDSQAALSAISNSVPPDTYVILGYPELSVEEICYNSAAVIYQNKVIANYRKQILPNYGVFDEKRYFQAGHGPTIFNMHGIRCCLAICEDLWRPDTCINNQAELIISINASPFTTTKLNQREQVLCKRAQENNIPIIYVNMVGGQDALLFDGSSLAVNHQGSVVARASFCREELLIVQAQRTAQQNHIVINSPYITPVAHTIEQVYIALTMGIRDYMTKNGISEAIVGLSGGIDSALTLMLTIDAIGKEKVQTFFLSTQYSRTISKIDAQQLADNCQVKHTVLSIEELWTTCGHYLAQCLPKRCKKNTLVTENLQARCRGIILMAIANAINAILLNTSNKSETAVGYTTLYGDAAGGLGVLQDVSKTLVYALANYRNSLATIPIIPTRILTRAPSAELKDNQQDSDTLPPYEILDQILNRYIECEESANTIIAAGFAADTVHQVINMVKNSEHKRRQAPIGLRITEKAFGRDRRYPVTTSHGYGKTANIKDKDD